MRKWIIFRAEKRQPGGEDRKYAHTGSLTKNLCEHYDCSDKPLPKIGYRPPEFIQVTDAIDPDYPEAKTHYRQSNWEVVRVETYTPDIPVGMSFDTIVICYCKYSPLNASLTPLPNRQMTIDSFHGNTEGYQRWLESQKEALTII